MPMHKYKVTYHPPFASPREGRSIYVFDVSEADVRRLAGPP